MNRLLVFTTLLLSTACPRSTSEPVAPPVQSPVTQPEPAKGDRIKRLDVDWGIATVTENGVVDFHGQPAIQAWLAQRGPIQDLWLGDGTCVRTTEGISCRQALANDEVRFEPPTKAEVIDVQWSLDAFWAVTSDGTLWYSWDDEPQSGPLEPFPGISGVLDIEAEGRRVCARLEDRSARCWIDQHDPIEFCTEAVGCEKLEGTWPAPRFAFADTRDTAISPFFMCILGEDGIPRCHGPGGPPYRSVGVDFAAIEGMPPLVEIDAGWSHVCGRSDAGEVWCWGSNEHGQLGDGTTQTRESRTLRVESLPPAEQLAAGYDQTCALADDEVWCWGSLPNTPEDPIPTEIPGIVARDLEFDAGSVCARVESGWKCWGGNNLTPEGAEAAAKIVDDTREGKFGDGCRLRSGRLRCEDAGRVWVDRKGVLDVSRHSYPLCALLRERVECHDMLNSSVISVPASVAVDGGEDYGCVLTKTGTVHCWVHSQPMQIPLPGKQVAVSVGYQDACALDEAGTVRCWSGEQALVVAGVTDVVQIDGGLRLGCARDRAGVIACWKDSSFPEPLTLAVEKPVTVPLPGPAADFGVHGHVCARLDDGRVFCWGRESYGQRARLSTQYATRPRKLISMDRP